MMFEKPNVLYFLFLLIIPILVHLFQLRKYKTTKFSNVAFLEQIRLQSRKSNRLKKWLILCTRLLGLTFLILAFAKPFIPNTDSTQQDSEVVVYLDNSYSMELPSQQTSLLEEAKQNLWSQLKTDQRFTLFTNNHTWENVIKADFTDDFFSIDFTPTRLSYQNLLLKAESLFNNQMSDKRLFIISDALNFKKDFRLNPEFEFDIQLILKEPTSFKNFYISNAQLQQNNTTTELSAQIESNQTTDEDVTVSLFNGSQLIAKSRAKFEDKTSSMVYFELQDPSLSEGILRINADEMSFDNSLYFSINQNLPIRVLVLESDIESQNSFLASIYSGNRFEYESLNNKNTEYSKISNADVILLNGIENVDDVLSNQINDFVANGGSLVIIPDEKSTALSYQNFNFIPSIDFNVNTGEQLVTNINFDHPIFKNVFSETIQNFDYPSTSNSVQLPSAFTPILSYSNGNAFLGQLGSIYVFSSSLQPSISNFINSPLVVPVFYNIAIQSRPSPELYSTIGEGSKIKVEANLDTDEVLKLFRKNTALIPQQVKRQNTVEINTQYQPESAGHYQLKHNDSTLLHLSFNYSREESQLHPLDRSQLDIKTFSSISSAFESYTEDRKILELWIWMLIFAVGLFTIELLILRFLN